MIATRKQIAAAEAAQKEFDKELAKTRALASKTTAEVNRLTAPKPSCWCTFNRGYWCC